MSLLLLVVAVSAFVYLLIKFANHTTTPKIPGIPEVPGLPFLGSLVEIGDCHARKALEWSKKYGPVFQVRLGNKVCISAVL